MSGHMLHKTSLVCLRLDTWPIDTEKIEMFSVQSKCKVRETAHYSLEEDFSIASTEPRGLSARFLNDLTTGVAGSEEESGDKPSE